jgi:hypothetical protein
MIVCCGTSAWSLLQHHHLMLPCNIPGRRWRQIMQREPVSLTLRYDNGWEWDAAVAQHVRCLGQVHRAC